MHGVYRRKKTGEILDKLRFRAWIDNGLITRMEEDAPFIEAYERFVFHMQSDAEGRDPMRLDQIIF